MSQHFVPSTFSLCQPDLGKSCGACCGLYNWKDHSRETVGQILERRTGLFLSCGKNPFRYGNRHAAETFPPNPKLCEEVYNCEFLGFLDPARRRIGCLLHPSLHEGNDLREESFYGRELCAGHLCPSHTHLTAVEQRSVVAALDDWYLYGLVLTDIDFVKEFFRQVQSRLGDSVHMSRLGEPAVQEALGDFYRLKQSWKFASPENRLGKYYFSAGEYQIARIDPQRRWRGKPSRFDPILLSLSSEFSSLREVEEAEFLIEEKMDQFVRAYQIGRDTRESWPMAP
jgi:hypothetical protein